MDEFVILFWNFYSKKIFPNDIHVFPESLERILFFGNKHYGLLREKWIKIFVVVKKRFSKDFRGAMNQTCFMGITNRLRREKNGIS